MNPIAKKPLKPADRNRSAAAILGHATDEDRANLTREKTLPPSRLVARVGQRAARRGRRG